MSDEVTPLSSDEEARFAPPSEEGESIVADEMIWSDGEQPFDEQGVVEAPPAEPSFLQRVVNIIFGGRSQEVTEQRLHSLSRAIEDAPETPANYVLRGELYLEVGEYELAEADFQRGLELAAAEFETSDWGIMAQAMRDRAEAGLASAQQHRYSNY
jgi:tetratricopeptide (TPR) repeat protein